MTDKLTPVEPDWEGMIRNLRRESTPERVYYFEHGVADNIQTAMDERFGFTEMLDSNHPHYGYERMVRFHRFLGHEVFRVFPPGARLIVPRREGEWIDESRGPVADWDEYERFDWPTIRGADFSVLEYLDKHPLQNMRATHVVDVWEAVRDVIGFQTFCYKLYEEPGFIDAVFERVGGFMVDVAETICDFDSFGVLYLSDDLGHKTSLMLAPQDVRRVILPWHKRIADIAHAHGKLVFFHSCGNMYPLIDDYIDTVGIDAKHSFEENIVPVVEAKRLYGDRLSLLGGVDVDFLARADEQRIRAHVRHVLDVCVPGGGYFLGSGNWVTEYIPVESYIAMLDEARRYTATRLTG